MNYKILIVDDERANLRVLERLLGRAHQIYTADSGSEALETLLLHDIALIISDQRMPEMTGLEFLKRAAELRQQTVRIILTGYTDAATLVDAINSGVVYKYITKPWINDELEITVGRALQYFESIKLGHKFSLEKKRLEERLSAAHVDLMLLVDEMLKLSDPYAYPHAIRVSKYARALGLCLGLSSEVLNQISNSVMLNAAAHIGTPLPLLYKTSHLTESEQKLAAANFERRVNLLSSIEEFPEMCEIVAYCNEGFDGSGFPHGLTSDSIPLPCRIISVARAYDLLTRPYDDRPPLSHNETAARLESEANERFDPTILFHLQRLEPLVESPDPMGAGLHNGFALGIPPMGVIQPSLRTHQG